MPEAPSPNAGVERRFSAAEMSRLSGVPVRRLAQWHRSGLLPAEVAADGTLRYAFRDVVTARTAQALLGAGVRATHVRRAIAALRAWRPDLQAPLASMRVFSDGGHLLVQVDGNVMEPVSGQLLLALPAGEITTVAARPGRVVQPTPAAEPAAWTGQGPFEAGLRAESAGDDDLALTHYATALEREPEHPGALLNLGNIHYRREAFEEALSLYRAAAAAAPEFPEAHYNLGNVLDDLGQADAAIRCYEHALSLDPGFKAAHFNLALAWEKAGVRSAARRHWQSYLGLEPAGESADIARSFLADDDAPDAAHGPRPRPRLAEVPPESDDESD
jgi:DNA-binding transcriptional MerR regulator